MAKFEDELTAAMIFRSAMLLRIAAEAIHRLEMPDIDWNPGEEALQLHALSADVGIAEALTAAILTRVGVSWEAIAAPYEVSRQALHRRLSLVGERQYVLSRRFDYRGIVVKALDDLAVYMDARQLRDVERDGAALAKELSQLRHVPHWWSV